MYNCIAWSVGIASRWIWPGDSLANFDVFYLGLGFVQAGDGAIAAWGLSPTKMMHGSVSGVGHGPRWESKCGADLRIQHSLDELTGSSYGRVVAFYRKRQMASPRDGFGTERPMKDMTLKPYLTAGQRRALRDECARIPVELRAAFAKAFGAWKSTWFAGGLAVNSNPHARSVGKEFDALIALGQPILPLVIEALADPENFFALELYDALQSNEKLLVQFEPDDERILEGEQGRARRVVQAWFTNR